MIGLIFIGICVAVISVYLAAKFIHGLRDFDIDDLDPLENGRKQR